MNEYDELAIKTAVERLVSEVSGETWNEIANILSRFMFWEFEDYEELHSQNDLTPSLQCDGAPPAAANKQLPSQRPQLARSGRRLEADT